MQKVRKRFTESHMVSKLVVIFLFIAVLGILGCEDKTTSSQNSSAVEQPQTTEAPTTTLASTPPTTAEATVGQTSKQDSSPIKTIKVEVIRVVDGDTIEAKIGQVNEKIRLIGVDTPETKHPSKPVEYYGKEASNYTASKLSGKTIYLELDVQTRDKYGRMLAYVWLSAPSQVNDKEIREKMFNAHLVLDGYAQLLTIPPAVKYVDYFTRYQREARDNNKGLWAQPTTTAVKATTTTQKIVVTTTTLQSIAPQNYGSDVTVYITDTGKKYHNDGCQYLSKSKHPISLSGAKESGYTPCSRCNPPQ